MEKILLAIEADQINTNTIEFACYVANLTHSKIAGIFLEDGSQSPVVKDHYGVRSGAVITETDPVRNNDSIRRFKESSHFFKEACNNRGVNAYIHHDHGLPVEEIIAESRFADLLIIDVETSFQQNPESIPTGFAREVLAKSECPVVIAPFSFYGIDEILFAYDGSPGSLFAIKQFSYLFPQFRSKKLTILQVQGKEDLPAGENDKLLELLQTHFSGAEFHYLQGNASDELFAYLLGKKSVFVVMGAFGRNMLSAFFRRSTAELVIKTINLPVFIAHH